MSPSQLRQDPSSLRFPCPEIHRITEWSGLAGPSVGDVVQPPAEAGSPTAGCKGTACSRKEHFEGSLHAGSSSACSWDGFVLIKVCLPSSGSSLQWSILLLGDAGQGIANSQGTCWQRRCAWRLAAKKTQRWAFRKAPRQCCDLSFGNPGSDPG